MLWEPVQDQVREQAQNHARRGAHHRTDGRFHKQMHGKRDHFRRIGKNPSRHLQILRRIIHVPRIRFPLGRDNQILVRGHRQAVIRPQIIKIIFILNIYFDNVKHLIFSYFYVIQ